ncbi:hypothetical protein CAPTEDRAFT_217704 [Capitella teleta]|uniref:Uncharacterized protein n=1 Tax=Capitella teleta TaxID=283909 RepID=X2AMK0_CAPTE|nr:hypothetical protein CAPTEDRAFT_217704 [Capitella teleta]|eukprot:ELU00320.1 hypothetical protein CAPTEDRAFT_217704 [Capitella teleta]
MPKIAWTNDQIFPDADEVRKNYDFTNYAANSTIHGVRYVMNTASGKIRRTLWIILLLGFLAYFLFVLFYRFEKMKAYPVTSRMSVVDVREVDFPAMTICNMNQIKLSYVNQDEFIKNVFLGHNTFTRDVRKVDIFSPEVIAKLDNEYSLRQIYKDGAFSMEGMFPLCNMKNERVNCGDFFTPIITTMGHCYTFNSAEVVKQRGQLKTRQPGANHGFQVYVNISQDDYFSQTGESAGIKVKKMPPPFGANTCFDIAGADFKNPLLHFHEYSKSRCVQECYMKYTITKCGCIEHNLEMENSTLPDCNYSQYITCIEEAQAEYIAKVDPVTACNCEDTCVKISHKITKSEATFPSKRKSADYVSVFPDVARESIADYARENFLVINLFIGELSYTLYEEEAAYSAGDFQSDVGGNLGLCLGASFLSLAELAELLLLGILGLVCKISKKKQQTKAASSN